MVLLEAVVVSGVRHELFLRSCMHVSTTVEILCDSTELKQIQRVGLKYQRILYYANIALSLISMLTMFAQVCDVNSWNQLLHFGSVRQTGLHFFYSATVEFHHVLTGLCGVVITEVPVGASNSS